MSDTETRLRQLEQLVAGVKIAAPIVTAVLVAAATFFGWSLSKVGDRADQAKKDAASATEEAARASDRVGEAVVNAKAALDDKLPELKRDLTDHAEAEEARLKLRIVVEHEPKWKLGLNHQNLYEKVMIRSSTERACFLTFMHVERAGTMHHHDGGSLGTTKHTKGGSCKVDIDDDGNWYLEGNIVPTDGTDTEIRCRAACVTSAR